MCIRDRHDPFHKIHMGVTAENVAAQFGISRAMQDALAVESHNRAERASAEGRFKAQIVPVVQKGRKGDVVFDTDEHFRPGCTLADMAKLKPVFVKENGSVQPGRKCSSVSNATSPLRPLSSTGTICDLKRPSALARSTAAAQTPPWP